MPELPEVHTTTEGVRKFVLNKTILSVWSDFHLNTAHGERQTIKNKKYFENFKKSVRGAKIVGAERKGKNILIHLNNQHTIVVHMKMTGNLLYGVADRFVHLKFELKGAKDLVLSDVRKFASVSLAPTKALDKHESLANLGPDALQITKRDFLKRLLRRKSWPIKSTLLDQTVLAGIGNIYSDEILWEVGVHPLSLTGKIPAQKIGEMHKAMKKILKFSIKYGGDSKSDYRNIHGEKGGFQNFHKAYGRKGQKCPKLRCSGIIERTVIKSRSSHFCPIHQKKYL